MRGGCGDNSGFRRISEWSDGCDNTYQTTKRGTRSGCVSVVEDGAAHDHPEKVVNAY